MPYDAQMGPAGDDSSDLTQQERPPRKRKGKSMNIFDAYAEGMPNLAETPTPAEPETGAFQKPPGKKKKAPKATSMMGGMRPQQGNTTGTQQSPLTAGLKAAAQGLAYIPSTGGTASSILRSTVGGALAGSSIADAITSARQTHDRMASQMAQQNAGRSLAEESVQSRKKKKNPAEEEESPE